MTSTAETDLLTSLVERKCRCLEQMLELGRQQTAIVSESEMNRLLQLVSAKQQLLAQLQELERQLDPFRLQQPAERRWRNEAARAHCGTLLVRAEQLFQEILQEERRSEEQLRKRRDETAVQLAHAQQATLARRAYLELPMTSSQLDLTSQS